MSLISPQRTMNKRTEGTAYEQRAAEYLFSQGYVITERNFRCRMGEIDLISRKDGRIIFSEVKFRSSWEFGLPSEAVDFRKRRIISNVAVFYLMKYGISPEIPIRFDVIAVSENEIRVYENAFDYCGNFRF